MMPFIAIWLASGAAVFAVVFVARSVRARHVARAGEVHWLALAILSLAVGILPALALDLTGGRPVVLPAELADRPPLGRTAVD